MLPKYFFFNLEQAYSTAIKIGMGLKMSTQNFVLLMIVIQGFLSLTVKVNPQSNDTVTTKYLQCTDCSSLPTQRDWPRPTSVVWWTASYVRVPDLDTIPTSDKAFHLSVQLTITQSRCTIKFYSREVQEEKDTTTSRLLLVRVDN